MNHKSKIQYLKNVSGDINDLLNEIFYRNQTFNSDNVLNFIKLLKPEQQEIFNIHSDDVEIFKLYNE